MGLFHKKNKEKNVPFWKRGKETPEEVQTNESLTEDAEGVVETALPEEQEAAEPSAAESELQENQAVAAALARQAAEEARAVLAQSEEPASAQESEDTATDSAEEELPEEEESSAVEEAPSVSEDEPEIAAETGADAEAEEDDTVEEQPAQKGFFAKIREGLRKTKDAMISRMQQVVGSFTKIDDELFDELEETMIMSDLGPETSVQICDTLRQRVKERNVTDPAEIMGMIQEIITEMLGEDQVLEYPTKPTVIMVIGVNGAGKTTTIGKLCHQLKSEGKKVLVAAADTFRAAAIDQLEVWTQRAGVDIVKHAEGSDPASVVYDAIDAAKARDCDVLICDTAGRLHNKKNLMQELAKINRIIANKAADCHKEILLVLDATTGQNAVNQARLFKEAADINGIVLTKLDGTAKGGIIVSIHNELGIPVKLVGVGEKIDDLQPFCGADFVRALFTSTEEA